MPPLRPFISLDDVTLRAGDDHLFLNTTWRIHEGEQWIVAGPNGGGKSTLLGAFDGRVPVIGGEVWYHFACTDPDESYPSDGTVPEDLIAVVSQEDQALLARAGSEYHQARWNASDTEAAPVVREVLHKRTGASSRAILHAARRTSIDHRLGHPLLALSNGELRRVLITESLLRKPRLLILDDPYAGLDTGARVQLDDLIAGLMADGYQLIIVVRRAEEIPEGATHLLYVAEGRVRAMGPIDSLRLHPKLRSFFSHRTAAPPPVSRRKKTSAPTGIGILSLREVTVRYDKTVALSKVSWTVRAGERWALMGPNGSGKSTLLSLLTGDNPQAYANDVSLFGRRRGSGESIWDIRKRIGWLSPELQWHVPGQDSVGVVVASGLFDTIGLHRRLTARQRGVVAMWLDRFQLPGDAPFASMGAGEQRMALLARALIKSPDLILLDEPCQGLDGANRKRFHRALNRALAGHPCALVYITHHEEDLPASVDQVLRLEQGRVVFRGSVTD